MQLIHLDSLFDKRSLSLVGTMFTLSLLLGSCTLPAFLDFGGEPEILSGDRVSVLSFQEELAVDPSISDVEITLPRPYTNQNWDQAGGTYTHAMHHLEIGSNLRQAWRTGIGDGSGKDNRLVTPPIVAGSVVYTLDSQATVSAFSTDRGRRLWRKQFRLAGESRDLGLGGGLAHHEGILYVATGFGYVVALRAGSGDELWRKSLDLPLRGAPIVQDGRVFVTTYDNQLFALSTDDGSEIWNHIGIIENAGLLGSPTPAVFGDILVVAYSSGELFALRTQNGRIAWSDSLSRTGRLTPMAVLSDIDGLPVIDRGRVFAISHGGRMVSIDLRTGERIWEQNIGGTQTPWVAGDYIYLVTTEGEVICLSRGDGRIRWLTRLQRWEDERDNKTPITWSGPVLASDRLLLVSSHGWAMSVSPYTGEILSGMKMPDDMYISPVVADRTMYVLTDSGDLVAMR